MGFYTISKQVVTETILATPKIRTCFDLNTYVNGQKYVRTFKQIRTYF